MTKNAYGDAYWDQIATWSAADQIVAYSEVVESLAISVASGRLDALAACRELAPAAFRLMCSPPDTGYISSSALLADEVSADPEANRRVGLEWPWIVYLSRVGSGRIRQSEENEPSEV